ncbi:MAG: glycosyltransferase family 4 protein [Candidatus Dormibacteria bacterium]
MRLLLVIQRYGADVFGGAETYARQLATRLAGRGHEVHVLTSCARDYVSWANHYPAGDEVSEGVHLHRLPTAIERTRLAAELDLRVFSSPPWLAPHVQREWMRQQGPYLPGLQPWLRRESGGFDANIFITYLYYTAYAGLKAAQAPSILHPTAHDELPGYLPLYDQLFRFPRALAFLTPEEGDFVRKRFRVQQPSIVTGIGIELDRRGDAVTFRERHGLGDRPYLVSVGRVDPGKGSRELFEFFIRYKERHPGNLALVYIGETIHPLPGHPDVVMTGFVSDEQKDAGVRGAGVLVQPSFFESFSLVLAEAWADGKPALVQARSPVLVGQAKRSGGGLPYQGYAEFEAGLDLLLEDPGLRAQMGRAGQAHVRRHYSWDHVLSEYETFLERVTVPARAALRP